MKPGDVLNIGVDATTDPLMQEQLKYNWYWITDQEPYYEELPPKDKYYRGVFKLSQKGKNLTIVMPDIVETSKDTYIRYRNISNRRYFVKIGHEFENVTSNFTIQGIEVTPPGKQFRLYFSVSCPEALPIFFFVSVFFLQILFENEIYWL